MISHSCVDHMIASSIKVSLWSSYRWREGCVQSKAAVWIHLVHWSWAGLGHKVNMSNLMKNWYNSIPTSITNTILLIQIITAFYTSLLSVQLLRVEDDIAPFFTYLFTFTSTKEVLFLFLFVGEGGGELMSVHSFKRKKNLKLIKKVWWTVAFVLYYPLCLSGWLVVHICHL